MPLFFRVIERKDGNWSCRQGLLELDTHHELENALSHLRDLAAQWGSDAELFVHRLDGSVTHPEPP